LYRAEDQHAGIPFAEVAGALELQLQTSRMGRFVALNPAQRWRQRNPRT
jgi:hypothetical protein